MTVAKQSFKRIGKRKKSNAHGTGFFYIDNETKSYRLSENPNKHTDRRNKCFRPRMKKTDLVKRRF